MGYMLVKIKKHPFEYNNIFYNYYLIFMTWMFEVVYGLLGYSQEVCFPEWL